MFKKRQYSEYIFRMYKSFIPPYGQVQEEVAPDFDRVANHIIKFQSKTYVKVRA